VKAKRGRPPSGICKLSRRDVFDLYVFPEAFLRQDSVLAPAERYQVSKKLVASTHNHTESK
jgi:hypothetical protein